LDAVEIALGVANVLLPGMPDIVDKVDNSLEAHARELNRSETEERRYLRSRPWRYGLGRRPMSAHPTIENHLGSQEQEFSGATAGVTTLTAANNTFDAKDLEETHSYC
jgi:hypothetical protein